MGLIDWCLMATLAVFQLYCGVCVMGIGIKITANIVNTGLHETVNKKLLVMSLYANKYINICFYLQVNCDDIIYLLFVVYHHF